MKPGSLKFSFPIDKREVTVQDRIWYVPIYYVDYLSFNFPGWNDPIFFPKARPVKIEYCSGNGAWIAEKARQHPDINWIAIERKFLRVRKIWSKLKNYDLDNLLIVCGEGCQATRVYFPDQTIEEVFINFPDPWPKTKHAKHRIIQAPFVQEVWRILKPAGTFTLVTDDPTYSGEMIKTLQRCPGFASSFPSPYFTTEWDNYGNSFFEDLWRMQGKQIHYHQFKKV